MNATLNRLVRFIRYILGVQLNKDVVILPREVEGSHCTLYIHHILNESKQKDAIEKRLRERISDLLKNRYCQYLCSWIEVKYKYSEKNKGWLFISCWKLKYKKGARFEHVFVVSRGGFFPKTGNLFVFTQPEFVRQFTTSALLDDDRFANAATLKAALELKKYRYDKVDWGRALDCHLH